MISHLDLFVVGAFGCLIYYSAGVMDAFGKLLNSSPFVCLGDWSYSVYLWHAPTHYAVMAAFAALNYPVSDLGLGLEASAFGDGRWCFRILCSPLPVFRDTSSPLYPEVR